MALTTPPGRGAAPQGHGGGATARRGTPLSCYVVIDQHRVPIYLGANGHLAVDQERLQAEKAFAAFGGEGTQGEGELHDILAAWRDIIIGIPKARTLPRPLRPAARLAQQTHRARVYRDKLDPDDFYRAEMVSTGDYSHPYSYGQASRLRTIGLVRDFEEDVIPRLGYEKPKGEGVFHLVTDRGMPTGGTIIRRPKKKYGDKSYYVRTVDVHFVVPLRWFYAVYLRGLAVIDGALVMDVIGETPHGTLVVAGRQTARLPVLPQFAYLAKGRLSWAYPHPPTIPHDESFYHGYPHTDVFDATLLVPNLPHADREGCERAVAAIKRGRTAAASFLPAF